mmetsp:Transcript_57302/g.101615  ORF Transcript_57302/g.101615 Transcript_57302/m.101615 type:complete len:1276 (+) Transcript_57302:45-3872(+)
MSTTESQVHPFGVNPMPEAAQDEEGEDILKIDELEENKKDEKAKDEEKRKKCSMAKLFSQLDGTDWLMLLLGVLGSAGNGGAQPVSMVLFGDFIDGLGGGGIDMMDNMADLAIQMCILGAAQTAASALQGGCFKVLADRQGAKLRSLYFDAVLHQDVGWFDQHEVAALPTEINQDIEDIIDAFGDKFGVGLMGACAFIGGFAGAFWMGWLMALVCLGVLPLMSVGAIIMGKAIAEIMLESQSWYGKAAAVVEECLYSMRTVVAFGGEHRELKKFTEAVLEARRGGVKNGFKLGLGLGYTMAVMFAGYGLAFYFGMTLRYNDEINPATGEPWKPGRILTIFFCIFIGSFSVGQIEPMAKAFHTALYGAGRFFETLENKPAIQERGDDKREVLKEVESFEFKNVDFYYPARPDVKVLNNLQLTVQRGQKTAFVGESGSGKSTVMALLERFYDASSGAVLVNGKDIKSLNISALRQCLGYVGQEPVLFATSIRENIMQGALVATKEDFKKVCEDAQLGFVDKLPEKYETFVGSGGNQFSGGQKQRIAIARALLKKASFLFLDEATSALDNVSEKMIQGTIDSISGKTQDGLGIVSIAHRLSTIRHSDRIYVLSRGSVVEQGNHEQLMEMKGTYYALAASQDASSAQQDETNETNDKKEEDMTRQVSDDSKDKKEKGKSIEKLEEEREEEIAKNYKAPMSRLMAFNKPEWPFFIPGIICALGDGASMPVLAVVLVQSMDAFFKPKEQMREDVQMLCIFFACLGAAQMILLTFEQGCFAILGEAMTQRIRVAVLTSIFRQEIGFHDDPENTPGKLSRALELYAMRVANLVKGLSAKAGSMTCLVVGLAIAFYACWEMSLVMLAAIPVMVVANAIQMAVIMGGAKTENSDLKQAQQILNEAVMNARTVQALGNEQNLHGLYTECIGRTNAGMWKRDIIAGIGFGVSNGCMMFILAGGFYYMGDLLKSGKYDFKDAQTAFMVIIYAAMGAGQAAAFVPAAAKASVACHDMFVLLDRVSSINGLEPTGETPQSLDSGNIEFINVKFFYPFRPQVQVLKGVSFKISAGQSVGLVGPSGGGKSTVMSLIQRFYDPQEGQVVIGSGGTSLDSLNIRWWRRQIGFVGQEPILFNTSVRENVLYGLADDETISEEKLEECKQMANLAFLDKNGNKGLATQVGPRGGRLSGGQKQRVAICRALVRNPPVLLLDEATSALDTQSERIVQKALEKARAGRTSFSIAHRLSTISGCDIIVVVADGSVVEQGNHQELMALGGVYAKLQKQSQL